MIEFFVPGIPVTKGSAKAFLNRKTGRPIVVQDNVSRQKPWVSMIGVCALQAHIPTLDGPVCISMEFVMPRPKHHYRTGKHSDQLRPDAPVYHTAKNADLDKLERCVLDALTGIAWHDDSQVALIGRAAKIYTRGVDQAPGVSISIESIACPL